MRRFAETEPRIHALEDLLVVYGQACGQEAPPQLDVPLGQAVAKAVAAAALLAGCGTGSAASTASLLGDGHPERRSSRRLARERTSCASLASAGAEEDRPECEPCPEDSLSQSGVVVRCGRRFIGPIFADRQHGGASSTPVPSPLVDVHWTGRRSSYVPAHAPHQSGLLSSRRALSPGASPRQNSPLSGLRRLSVAAVASPRAPGHPRVGSPAKSPRGGEQAAVLAGITSALRLLEPRLVAPLQERLDATVQQLEAAREQVREQGRQNAQLQRKAEEQRNLLQQLSEFEEQNQMLATRLSGECPSCAAQDRTHEVVAEERLEWERCCLAAEDLAVERLRHLEHEALRKREREWQRREASLAAQAWQQITEINRQIEELQRFHSGAAKMAAANRTMLRRIDKLRRHERWR